MTRLVDGIQLGLVYSPQLGKSEEEKDIFWDMTFQLVSDKTDIFADDLNEHMRRINTGYVGILALK